MRYTEQDMILIEARRREILQAFAARYEQKHIDRLESELFKILEQKFKGEDIGAVTLTMSQFLDRMVWVILKDAEKADTKLVNPTTKRMIIQS